MLTKILTAVIGIVVALMVLRFIADRAHRAQLRARTVARQRREDGGEASSDARRNPVTTLEADPDTGVYRPKT